MKTGIIRFVRAFIYGAARIGSDVNEIIPRRWDRGEGDRNILNALDGRAGR
jgi:hypothetical protein